MAGKRDLFAEAEGTAAAPSRRDLFADAEAGARKRDLFADAEAVAVPDDILPPLVSQTPRSRSEVFDRIEVVNPPPERRPVQGRGGLLTTKFSNEPPPDFAKVNEAIEQVADAPLRMADRLARQHVDPIVADFPALEVPAKLAEASTRFGLGAIGAAMRLPEMITAPLAAAQHAPELMATTDAGRAMLDRGLAWSDASSLPDYLRAAAPLEAPVYSGPGLSFLGGQKPAGPKTFEQDQAARAAAATPGAVEDFVFGPVRKAASVLGFDGGGPTGLDALVKYAPDAADTAFNAASMLVPGAKAARRASGSADVAATHAELRAARTPPAEPQTIGNLKYGNPEQPLSVQRRAGGVVPVAPTPKPRPRAEGVRPDLLQRDYARPPGPPAADVMRGALARHGVGGAVPVRPSSSLTGWRRLMAKGYESGASLASRVRLPRVDPWIMGAKDIAAGAKAAGGAPGEAFGEWAKRWFAKAGGELHDPEFRDLLRDIFVQRADRAEALHEAVSTIPRASMEEFKTAFLTKAIAGYDNPTAAQSALIRAYAESPISPNDPAITKLLEESRPAFDAFAALGEEAATYGIIPEQTRAWRDDTMMRRQYVADVANTLRTFAANDAEFLTQRVKKSVQSGRSFGLLDAAKRADKQLDVDFRAVLTRAIDDYAHSIDVMRSYAQARMLPNVARAPAAERTAAELASTQHRAVTTAIGYAQESGRAAPKTVAEARELLHQKANDIAGAFEEAQIVAQLTDDQASAWHDRTKWRRRYAEMKGAALTRETDLMKRQLARASKALQERTQRLSEVQSAYLDAKGQGPEYSLVELRTLPAAPGWRNMSKDVFAKRQSAITEAIGRAQKAQAGIQRALADTETIEARVTSRLATAPESVRLREAEATASALKLDDALRQAHAAMGPEGLSGTATQLQQEFSGLAQLVHAIDDERVPGALLSKQADAQSLASAFATQKATADAALAGWQEQALQSAGPGFVPLSEAVMRRGIVSDPAYAAKYADDPKKFGSMAGGIIHENSIEDFMRLHGHLTDADRIALETGRLYSMMLTVYNAPMHAGNMLGNAALNHAMGYSLGRQWAFNGLARASMRARDPAFRGAKLLGLRISEAWDDPAIAALHDEMRGIVESARAGGNDGVAKAAHKMKALRERAGKSVFAKLLQMEDDVPRYGHYLDAIHNRGETAEAAVDLANFAVVNSHESSKAAKLFGRVHRFANWPIEATKVAMMAAAKNPLRMSAMLASPYFLYAMAEQTGALKPGEAKARSDAMRWREKFAVGPSLYDEGGPELAAGMAGLGAVAGGALALRGSVGAPMLRRALGAASGAGLGAATGANAYLLATTPKSPTMPRLGAGAGVAVGAGTGAAVGGPLGLLAGGTTGYLIDQIQQDTGRPVDWRMYRFIPFVNAAGMFTDFFAPLVEAPLAIANNRQPGTYEPLYEGKIRGATRLVPLGDQAWTLYDGLFNPRRQYGHKVEIPEKVAQWLGGVTMPRSTEQIKTGHQASDFFGLLGAQRWVRRTHANPSMQDVYDAAENVRR